MSPSSQTKIETIYMQKNRLYYTKRKLSDQYTIPMQIWGRKRRFRKTHNKRPGEASARKKIQVQIRSKKLPKLPSKMFSQIKFRDETKSIQFAFSQLINCHSIIGYSQFWFTIIIFFLNLTHSGETSARKIHGNFFLLVAFYIFFNDC